MDKTIPVVSFHGNNAVVEYWKDLHKFDAKKGAVGSPAFFGKHGWEGVDG